MIYSEKKYTEKNRKKNYGINGKKNALFSTI